MRSADSRRERPSRRVKRRINRKLGDTRIKLFELPGHIHLPPHEDRPAPDRLLTRGARTAAKRAPILMTRGDDLCIGLDFVPNGFTIANRALIAAIRVDLHRD